MRTDDVALPCLIEMMVCDEQYNAKVVLVIQFSIDVAMQQR